MSVVVSKPSRIRTRRFTVTYYPKDGEQATWCKAFHDHVINTRPTRFFIGQVEKCPTTDRFHVQAYVEFVDALDFSTVKKTLPDGAHFLPSKGDSKANIQYCSKEDTAVQGTQYRVGEPMAGQGFRTDLHELVEDISKRGATADELIDSNPSLWLRAHKLVDKCTERYQLTRRDAKVESVTFRFGPTSTGKTTTAIERLEGLGTWYMPPYYKDTLAMNGYKTGDNIIFDDFTSKTVPTETLLKMLRPPANRPLQVNCKGCNPSFVYIDPKHIEITSNFMPEDLWSTPQALKAVCARVTHWFYHPKIGEHVESKTYEDFLFAIKSYDSRPLHEPLQYTFPNTI